MPIRAIVFDVGSVLVQDMDRSYREAWAERLGLDYDALSELVFDSEEAARATVGEATYAAVWEHVAQALGLNAERLARLERDFWRGDRVDAALADFLRSLRPRYFTALLSDAWPNARRRFIEEFGLGDAVDAMIISAEVGLRKPDPRIYRLALDRAGVTAEAALFLDDREKNVAAARELGICAIQYQTTPQAIAAIERRLENPELCNTEVNHVE